ncbi:MAG: response regulator transcription factor [Sphingobacteriales bacterium]|nr:response regulator transcription factor [Sphingobacteriales bacterium]
MISLLEEVKVPKQIFTASDYASAQEQLAAASQDIVLLDINMPGKNGIELLKYIREKQADAEVIMLTNHSDGYYRDQCTELGARYFLDKSNDFSLVPEIVSGYCLKNFEKNQPE